MGPAYGLAAFLLLVAVYLLLYFTVGRLIRPATVWIVRGWSRLEESILRRIAPR